jgi:glycerophosphoryl diester phosphodiesterase
MKVIFLHWWHAFLSLYPSTGTRTKNHNICLGYYVGASLGVECITLSTLSPSTTTVGPNNTTSNWLAGLRPDDFPGNTTGEQLAYAARSIKAGILSPAAVAAGTDPALPGYTPFATKEMIDQAQKLGVAVKPWTVRFQQRLRANQNAER